MDLKPTYVFALQQEAYPFIEQLKVKQIHQQKNIRLYANDHSFLLITGIGSIACSTAVGWFLALHKNVVMWNIGCAASQANLHKWQRIIEVKNKELTFYPELIGKSEFELNSLNTVSDFVGVEDLMSYGNELVDMEGISFAKAAQLFLNSNQIQIFKWVSDAGHKDFYKDGTWFKKYERQIPEIITVVDLETKLISTEVNAIFKNTNQFVSKIDNLLKLSFTQKEQLNKACLCFLAYKTELQLAELIEEFTDSVENISQRKSLLNQLLEKLRHV
ncbi:MAG: hypothetical protein ACK5QC_10125 [Bacteroidota bacterium]|jgi:hypothetical protein|nr:hypothetical protein [Bacteroidota bacterium]MCA6442412.1 hypothetical protein [Bacteroidota bacterium]